MKARNLARDARGALYVIGEDFWHYAVGSGTATLSAVARSLGDPTTDELAELSTAFYGDIDRGTFDEEMIKNKRLVVRLGISRVVAVSSRQVPAARPASRCAPQLRSDRPSPSAGAKLA